MATLIIFSIILASVAWIIFRQLKKGSTCADCQCSCPLNQTNKMPHITKIHS
ncbi:FeoB-associated Cys-rich membrane protein [Vaginisenegalia massiliensis]|uniref:FeoB-associated Cys-rich membrane protein n=1 Tax=Vaginisenegalia massiliensis TaxID=2058294 RepID=UPI000F549D4E